MELWLAAIAVLIVGVLITFRGVRGRRVDDHPVCRKCGFDLVGAKEGTERCAECGGDLSERRAVRLGNRRRNRGIVGLGVLVLLIGVGGVTTLGVLNARGVNWNAYKPTWLLRSELQSKDGATAGDAGKEIAARINKGNIDEEGATRVVDMVLELQGDAARPWNGDISGVLTVASARGLMNKAQLGRFIEQSVASSIDIPVELTAHMPIATTFKVSHDSTAHWMKIAVLATCEMEIDGKPVKTQLLGADPKPGDLPFPMARQLIMGFTNGVVRRGVSGTATYEFHLAADLPPGEHEIVIRVRHDAVPEDRIEWRLVGELELSIRNASMPEPRDPADVIRSWTVEKTFRVNVK